MVTAKKERRKNAFKEAIAICLRTFIQNQINPTPSQLEELLQSKAREHSVERRNLPSVSVLLGDVQSRILELEFIPRDTKERVLEEIGNLRQQILVEVAVEAETETTEIIGGFLFAFMTMSVLYLVVMTAIKLGGIEISSEPVLEALLFALGGLTAAAIGIRTTSKEEKPKEDKNESRDDRFMKEIRKKKAKQEGE